MSNIKPAEFVQTMIDAGESKIFMSTRDTILRGIMAGAILAVAVVVAFVIVFGSVVIIC